MGRMCVAGHQNFGCKELEECGIKWERMAGNSEEGQGPQRAVMPMMTMMMMMNLNSSAIRSSSCIRVVYKKHIVMSKLLAVIHKKANRNWGCENILLITGQTML
jgi:hypothetical protein